MACPLYIKNVPNRPLPLTQRMRRRGVSAWDLVILKTSRGQVRIRAFVTDDIMPGTIDANMGGGGPVGPKAWQECNINELTDLQL